MTENCSVLLPMWSDTAGWNNTEYYSTMKTARIRGLALSHLLIRGPQGLLPNSFDVDSAQWHPLPDGPALSDTEGWNRPEYYATIQYADIDGDGADELVARAAGGMECWKYNPQLQSWTEMAGFSGWSDANNGFYVSCYRSIRSGDIDGNGRKELLAISQNVLSVYEYDLTRQQWQSLPNGPAIDIGPSNAPDFFLARE